MPAERASSLGRKLRDARERRGSSLREVANTTKISAAVLEALERDDISRLPGGIFGRAFVRAFAEAVGLDPDAAIQEFVAQFPNEPAVAGLSASVPIEDHEALENDRRLVSTFLTLLGLCIPIAGLIVYFSISGRPAESPRGESVQPSTTRTDIELASEIPAEAAAPLHETETPAAAAALTVDLTLVRPSWVEATVDDSKRFAELLPAGEKRTLEADREVVLRVGDAGALTLTINGMEAKPLGKAGAVATARLTPANFKAYLVER